MTVFVYYLLKMVLCSGILYGYYLLALKNKLFHQWNRFFLLSAILLSLLLPLITFTIDEPEQTDAVLLIQSVQSADLYIQGIADPAGPEISAEQWILFGYCCLSIVLLFVFVRALVRIRHIIRSYPVQSLHNIHFINTKEQGTPFSFLRYIFWNENIHLQSETGQQIFQHELVHVEEKHTLDKLFLQLVLIVFWCNPFFWLIRRELRFIHEFIADQKAVGQHGLAAFSAMILQAAYPQQFNQLVNPFFQTSIKRRIMMLKKTRNPKLAYASRLIALPLVAATVFAFTVRTEHSKTSTQEEGTPLTAVEKNLSVPVSDTIPSGKRQIITVDVRKKAGATTNEIAITYSDGSSETLSEKEAMERGLIHNGGYGNQPVTSQSNLKGSLRLTSRNGEKPLFILDGKEIEEGKLGELDPKKIETINVIKDASALHIYGEKGKNGVILIKTKSQHSGTPLSLHENGQEVLKGKITSVQIARPDSLKLEAEEVVVMGRKLNKAEARPANEEVVVQGYKKTPESNEVTVIGRKLENQPVFEMAEFAPSVDMEEWRRFLEKYTRPIVEEIGKKVASGRYTVNVRFIVEKDGSVTNVKVLNDPGHGFGAKVYEIMKHAPKWKPAIQNEKVVRSYHTQPITFVIADT